ncbi:hypothetical protein AMATHDRAFT_6566 [Amanita thiersii Skay4041]|uniref:Uncharacterized protein n=1 Tax=Amanita thiersii Skay4041 TaxID=703135 RepID=A0A2A9NAJ2_9AGAR|nr:hypothetical protein AMATHDRAFT_6566 [Amanita thiersii Skay4041]
MLIGGDTRSYIIVAFVQAVFSGLYVATFLQCIRWLAFSNQGWAIRDRISWLLLTMTCCIFALSIANLAIFCYIPLAYIRSDLSRAGLLRAVLGLLESLTVVLADSVLIYRCWVVYTYSLLSIGFPLVLWIGYICLSIILNYFSTAIIYHPEMDDSPSVSSILRGSIIGIYICTIGVNVYTTTAIILRIWRVTNTDTSSSTRRGLSFTTRVTAESGLLYTVSSVMGMIAWLNSLDKQTPGSILAVAIFSSIVSMTLLKRHLTNKHWHFHGFEKNFSMIGIAFNFLLIRVAQQRASSDSTNASASTAGKYIQMTDMRVVQHEITEIASGAPKDRTNSMLPPTPGASETVLPVKAYNPVFLEARISGPR